MRGTLSALVLTVAVLGGCTVGGDEPAFIPIAGSNSAYCKTYRAWKVYELDNGEAFDQPTAAALRTWWNAYLVAEETMLQYAPPEIRAAVGVKVSRIRTVLTPLMEKYGFDLRRVQREGAATEQAALFGLAPAEVQKAQEAQYAYEDRACGTASTPPAADVVFDAGVSSRAYCAALSVFDGELDKVAASGFDPGAMRTLVTGDRFSEILDGLDTSAPPEIAADVAADTEWFRTRWSGVVERYGFDLRRIYVDAAPEELAVFNRIHPAVLEHTSRTTAYQEQVCESGSQLPLRLGGTGPRIR